MPSLRRLRQRTGRSAFAGPADQATRSREEGQHKTGQRPDEAGRQGGKQRRGQPPERSSRGPESCQQQVRLAHRAARPFYKEPAAGYEEGGAKPQGHSPQAEQELDPRLVKQADGL